MRSRGMEMVLLLALLPSTGACVVNRAISAGAVADNRAVARAQNEVLLLNVLRAKDREPMYLTDISLITGSIKAEADLAPTAPFGSFGGNRGGDPAHYSVAPTLSYNWNPNFNVNVLDTQDFMSGFLAPVTSDTFAFFWNQGFPPEVLLNLLVRKVTVRKIEPKGCKDTAKPIEGDVTEYSLENYPSAKDEGYKNLSRFNEWIQGFLEANPRAEAGDPATVGPPVAGPPDLKELIKAAAAKLGVKSLEDPKGMYQLESGGGSVLKLLEGQGLKELWESAGKLGGFMLHYEEEESRDICKSEAKMHAKAGTGRLVQSYRAVGAPGAASPTYELIFDLRSPQATLYYLGELARVEENTGKAFSFCIQGELQPLFVVRRRGGVDSPDGAPTAQCGSGEVEAEAGGRHYLIPHQGGPHAYCECTQGQFEVESVPCLPGRSMQALSVASQLIALQKSAKDLQATGVVRVLQ